MESERWGTEDARDPVEQLRLASRAAGLAVERVVAPWWIYVLSGVFWGAVFAFAMGAEQLWLWWAAILVGASLAGWVRAHATGVKISERLQWKGIDIQAVVWILGALGVMLVMMMVGNVLLGLFDWRWATWAAGAVIGAFCAVTEWRVDLRVRQTMRGWR